MLTHAEFPIEELTIGHIVWFYDEDKQCHPFLITAINSSHFTGTARHVERPKLNGTIFLTSGKVSPIRNIPPAYEDDHGTPRLIRHWSLPQEFPLINKITGEPNYSIPERK